MRSCVVRHETAVISFHHLTCQPPSRAEGVRTLPGHTVPEGWRWADIVARTEPLQGNDRGVAAPLSSFSRACSAPCRSERRGVPRTCLHLAQKPEQVKTPHTKETLDSSAELRARRSKAG